VSTLTRSIEYSRSRDRSTDTACSGIIHSASRSPRWTLGRMKCRCCNRGEHSHRRKPSIANAFNRFARYAGLVAGAYRLCFEQHAVVPSVMPPVGTVSLVVSTRTTHLRGVCQKSQNPHEMDRRVYRRVALSAARGVTRQMGSTSLEGERQAEECVGRVYQRGNCYFNNSPDQFLVPRAFCSLGIHASLHNPNSRIWVRTPTIGLGVPVMQFFS